VGDVVPPAVVAEVRPLVVVAGAPQAAAAVALPVAADEALVAAAVVRAAADGAAVDCQRSVRLRPAAVRSNAQLPMDTRRTMLRPQSRILTSNGEFGSAQAAVL